MVCESYFRDDTTGSTPRGPGAVEAAARLGERFYHRFPKITTVLGLATHPEQQE